MQLISPTILTRLGNMEMVLVLLLGLSALLGGSAGGWARTAVENVIDGYACLSSLGTHFAGKASKQKVER